MEESRPIKPMTSKTRLWVFGYGSLLWKHSHPSTQLKVCFIQNFERRLWQGSPDHRGSPQFPGRVATLIDAPGKRCWGLAQQVPDEDAYNTLLQLDQREQAGYERLIVPLHDENGVFEQEGLVYRASESNPHYLGPASVNEMVEHILSCEGPSGANTEYVLRLDEALQKMHCPDMHIGEIAAAIRNEVGHGL